MIQFFPGVGPKDGFSWGLVVGVRLVYLCGKFRKELGWRVGSPYMVHLYFFSGSSARVRRGSTIRSRRVIYGDLSFADLHSFSDLFNRDAHDAVYPGSRSGIELLKAPERLVLL